MNVRRPDRDSTAAAGIERALDRVVAAFVAARRGRRVPAEPGD